MARQAGQVQHHSILPARQGRSQIRNEPSCCRCREPSLHKHPHRRGGPPLHLDREPRAILAAQALPSPPATDVRHPERIPHERRVLEEAQSKRKSRPGSQAYCRNRLDTLLPGGTPQLCMEPLLEPANPTPYLRCRPEQPARQEHGVSFPEVGCDPIRPGAEKCARGVPELEVSLEPSVHR